MKFTIITPVFNGRRFLAETMDSVLSQEGAFELEYVVRDGGSTDETIELLKDFEKRPRRAGVTFRWASEPDRGMYDAINKGFEGAKGDVFAYLNADDVYEPGALELVRRVLSSFQEIRWLKGITSYINEQSRRTEKGRCNLYHQDWIRRGLYGPVLPFIQQDSVFWRANLWREAGPMNPALRLAGDYELWTKFARVTPLFSLNAEVSCFRQVAGQLSADFQRYYDECRKVADPDGWSDRILGTYFRLQKRVPAEVRENLFRAFFPARRAGTVLLGEGGLPMLTYLRANDL